MEHKAIRSLTATKRIVTGLVFLLVALPFYDAASNAPYRARALSCRANLTQIGRAIAAYRDEHGGSAPTGFHPLLATLGSEAVLVCPLSGYVTLPAPLERSYICRFPARPRAGDAVVWDSGPHRPWHSIFVFMNRDNRNVLYADGRVITVSEPQFQRLHLQGQSIIIPKQ